MDNKYNLVTIEPTMDLHLGAAHGGADILFGWQAIEIPTGTCSVKTIAATIAGINGAAGNTHDINIYFARSISGVAPTSFGTEHAANAVATTAAFRRNLIGWTFLDLSSIDDGDIMVGYSVLGARSSSSADGVGDGGYNSYTILQGDPAYPSTKGYQTIWVAATGRGAFDFGTDVDLDMASNQAASTAAVQITTDSTDPRNCFQPGDKLIGETGGPTMEVVSVDSDVLMTVKNISEQIDDNEQLVLRSPIRLMLGLEY
jgi:hypothetical protein